MSDAVMGHNSIHASPEEFATLVRKAKRCDVLEVEVKKIGTELRQTKKEFELARRTFHRITSIGDTNLSATAKNVATHLAIAAMNSPDGDGRVSREQLQRWASLKDRQSVPGVLDELVSARLLEIAKRPMGGNRQYTIRLASDADLQSAVEALRSTTASNVVLQNCAAARHPNRGSNPHSANDRGSNPHLNEGQTLTQRPNEGQTLTQMRVKPSLSLNEGQTLTQTGKIDVIQSTAQPTESVRTLYSEKDSSNRTGVQTERVEYVTTREVWHALLADVDLADRCSARGLTLDGRAIRHRDFLIDLEVAWQAQPNMPPRAAADVALSYAFQWALEIEAGKPADKVLPTAITPYIRRMVQKSYTNMATDANVIARSGKSPQNVPSWHNRIDPRGSMRDA